MPDRLQHVEDLGDANGQDIESAKLRISMQFERATPLRNVQRMLPARGMRRDISLRGLREDD